MKLRFTKMQGLGNDFMIVDCINQRFSPSIKQIQHWSDRHFGIGFDQLLLIEAGDQNNDFFYRIYNADGSHAGQCGNGARCFARYVKDRGLTAKDTLQIGMVGGQITLKIEPDNQVSVNLGKPILEPKKIPFIADHLATTYTLMVNNEPIKISAVSLGNPHCVILVKDVSQAPVTPLGKNINQSPLFPEGVNVGFVEILSSTHIKLRVFERGAGETLACGSGAAAAVVAGRLQQILDSKVQVSLPGGDLTITWPDRDSPVWMKGPANYVFDGTIALENDF